MCDAIFIIKNVIQKHTGPLVLIFVLILLLRTITSLESSYFVLLNLGQGQKFWFKFYGSYMMGQRRIFWEQKFTLIY